MMAELPGRGIDDDAMCRAIEHDDATAVLELLARPGSADAMRDALRRDCARDIRVLADPVVCALGRRIRRSWLMRAVTPERPSAFRALLAAGVGWHIKDGWTLLHHVCKVGHLACVRVALCFPAAGNPNSRDKYGNTPLHFVCSTSPDLVELLIEHGADVNAQNNSGVTPLHCACSRSLDIVGLLIAHGADVNAQDNRGETPSHWAVGFHCPDEWARQAAICAALTRAGANANIRSAKGDTPLHSLLQ